MGLGHRVTKQHSPNSPKELKAICAPVIDSEKYKFLFDPLERGSGREYGLEQSLTKPSGFPKQNVCPVLRERVVDRIILEISLQVYLSLKFEKSRNLGGKVGDPAAEIGWEDDINAVMGDEEVSEFYPLCHIFMFSLSLATKLLMTYYMSTAMAA